MEKVKEFIKRTMPNVIKRDRKGIALLVALGTMIVILVIASLGVYLITRGLNITGGQTRYETAYEAAVASMEIGKEDARFLNQNLDSLQMNRTINVGKYTSQIHVERTSNVAITMSGTAMKFARAISGPGQTPATGSYRTYYIRIQSQGTAGEQVMLEVLQRYTILAQ